VVFLTRKRRLRQGTHALRSGSHVGELFPAKSAGKGPLSLI
jgi:hypothetical protein